jgi:glycosyltransferase involved in cell wall biosynthesis
MVLRVAHVIGGLELGGAETILYRLATHSIPDIEQHVICLGRPDWYSSRLSEKGIRVQHLGMNSPLSALARVRQLRSLLRQIDPDVIQSWMYLSNMLSSAVARRSATPVVWGIHNSSFERVGLASRISAYVAGAAARRLASFVVNCSRHSAELHAKLGYSGVANAVIANGYDPAAFQPDSEARASTRRALGVGDHTFVIGSVARWHPHKDIPNLLSAVRIAADEGTPLRCLLVGRELGPDNPELTAAIRAAGVEDLVVPLGPRSDIPELARAFDLHVLSSRSEAFPNVIAETMLSGTPNVATDTGDSAAIVGDEGWVVPAASPRTLAEAIIGAHKEWSQNAAQWQRRREASRQRIAENFTFEKMAQAYVDVWRKVAAAAA